MPGFDGTGPSGEGPMTGGARGWCGTGAGRRPFGYGVGRGGLPRGGGRGRAWGGGRGGGRGYGRGYAVPQANPEDERAYLADQLSLREQEIREIRERLAQLDANKESE